MIEKELKAIKDRRNDTTEKLKSTWTKTTSFGLDIITENPIDSNLDNFINDNQTLSPNKIHPSNKTQNKAFLSKKQSNEKFLKYKLIVLFPKINSHMSGSRR